MTGTDTALSVNNISAVLAERRSVMVLRLPERSTAENTRGFLCEMQQCMSNGRPYLVLDCSAVSQLDRQTAGLMLHCLEETMKRNGDVKLAGISLTTQPQTGFAGANRLFEIFDTIEDAMSSFHQLPFEAANASESAA